MKTLFGDVVSSALSLTPSQASAGQDLFANFRLTLGQIRDIYTVDDSRNNVGDQPGQYTLYDVQIIRNDGTTEMIRRCRMLQPGFGGGINNFFEVLPTVPGPQDNDGKKSKNDKRGHMVLVGFIEGQKSAGVILGGIPHASDIAVDKRPTKDLGVYAEGEIQGLNYSINNDGELLVTFNGPRDDKGEIVSENGPTEIWLDKEGNVEISTNAEQSFHIDRVNKKITVTNGPTILVMDQEADKIQVQATIVEVGDAALQPMVVGDDWKKIMEELIDAICQIIVPTGVGPSGTPVNAPQFQQIRAKLKDALSQNHLVEK